MRRVPSDSETAARCNGNSIHSILKETHRIPSISEGSRNRHLSNESCGSVKGVTFDKSLPTNAFRNDRDVSSQSLRNRRTSLPVNTSLHPRLRDQGNVSEARGLIMDMLQNRDLQPQVISCLRAVASLLTPQMSVQNGNFMEFLPKVVENPYSGEQLTVSSASKPRVSNITFSTVTSATGLPTIAAEPSRPRSSNHWKPIHQDGPVEPPQPSSAAPPPTCQRQHHSSQSCSCLSQQTCQVHKPKEKSLYRRRYSSATEERSLKVIADGRDDAETAASEDAQAEKERRRSAGANVHPSPILINSSSTFSHSLSPSPFAKSPSVVAKSPSPSVAFSLHEEPEDGEPQSPPENEAKARTAASIDTWTTEDGIVYNKRELDRDKALHRIDEWSFPVFDLAEAYKTTVLSRITYAVFKQADLFNIFKISPQKFFNFFHALEMGYWEIPYHNRIHAADVLHGCHYLTCHPVNAFHPTPSTPDDEITEGMEDLNIDSLFDSSSISIASTMNGLELMALYTAAAMHDFDHPGRTNAFLVAAEDKKAILYNDRSVLENHHAAESWKLLSKPENNFIDVLDAAETKRFRYLVLEYILATDLKQHFDIIMSFNDKAGDMDLSNEADRVLVSQMLIKFADINSPAKPYTLHRQWTDRICQEFYEQGDEEKVRNMPVSPYMDRNEPAVAKLQDSFIAHIVNPLVIALNEAGLLPSMPGLEDPEVIINLKHNHQKWLTEIEEHNPQEEEPKEEQEQDFGSASTTTATAFENDKIIYSMKEVEKKEDLVMNGACEKGDNEILGRFE